MANLKLRKYVATFSVSVVCVCMCACLCVRGHLLILFNSFKEAELDCTKAITLDPQYVKAHQRRGVARQFLKLYDDSIKGVCALVEAWCGR